MSKKPHRFAPPDTEFTASTATGFMSLKQVAEHFAVSETTIRRGRHEFAGLRQRSIGGVLGKDGKMHGTRTLIPRVDVENLSRKLEREAMSVDAECVTEKEVRREERAKYRRRIGLA